MGGEEWGGEQGWGMTCGPKRNLQTEVGELSCDETQVQALLLLQEYLLSTFVCQVPHRPHVRPKCPLPYLNMEDSIRRTTYMDMLQGQDRASGFWLSEKMSVLVSFWLL